MSNSFEFTGAGMGMTNYFVDTIVAYKMSEITKCDSPDMESEDKKWLNRFLLNAVFGVTIEPKQKSHLFNFVRRVEGSFSAYHEARNSLIEHVATPNNKIFPYFRSLLNFEICISQLYQGIELLCQLTGNQAFDKGSNCEYERLHNIYIDSKHMDKMIEGGKLPDGAMCAVWITNEGLESARSKISFKELTSLMRCMANIAEQAATLKPNSNNSPFNKSLNLDAP